jgi:hypothetical protein
MQFTLQIMVCCAIVDIGPVVGDNYHAPIDKDNRFVYENRFEGDVYSVS